MCPLQIRFQERPWDLLLAVGYTLILSAVLAALDTGTVLAIVLIAFVPGYVLVALLYPTWKQVDWIERLALSLGLSLGIVPLLGLALNFTPFGVRLVPILATLSGFTVGVATLAYVRRMRLPIADRLAFTLVLNLPGSGEEGAIDRILALGVAASVIVAGLAFAYVLVVPKPGERFTEFYLLGPGGNASGYPTRLNVSESTHVTIGIVDHEAATVPYTVRVDLLGVRIQYNASNRYNETVIVNGTTWSWFNTTLTDRQSWTQAYPFSIAMPGQWDVRFILYKDGGLSNAYRMLDLFIRVT